MVHLRQALIMKKLPRQQLVVKLPYGKIAPYQAQYAAYSSNRRTNRFFEMAADDFRVLNKPFTVTVTKLSTSGCTV